jgi:hypothetical protein
MYSDTVLLGKDAVIGKVTETLTEVPFRLFRAVRTLEKPFYSSR